MSILIHGMKMPKNCIDCWALDDYGDYPRCRITEEQRGYNFLIKGKRMDNCPLVHVPPHGRLIDADDLQIERSYFDTYNDYSITFDLIDCAPTVIGAEDCSAEQDF